MHPQLMNPMQQPIQQSIPQPIQPFDPAKLDKRLKRSYVSHTLTCSQIGLYKKFPVYAPIIFPFVDDFEPGPPNNICEVSVEHDHVIDIAEIYAEHGVNNYGSYNNMNPVILNSVGKDFNGSNFEDNDQIRDEIINIRTTFSNTVNAGNKYPYPMKEAECVYSKILTIIRPKNVHTTKLDYFLPWPQSFRTAIITATPIKADKDNMLNGGSRMGSLDFVKTCTVIEAVFQAAIKFNHPVLILAPFGHLEENNPIEDIIRIYNYCIFKYGHWFKKIIIGIPPHYPDGVFAVYNKEIVRPQELVFNVDKKYEKEEMRKSLLSKTDQSISNNNINEKEHKKKIKNKHKDNKEHKTLDKPEYSQEQLEMFMNMLKTINN